MLEMPGRRLQRGRHAPTPDVEHAGDHSWADTHNWLGRPLSHGTCSHSRTPAGGRHRFVAPVSWPARKSQFGYSGVERMLAWLLNDCQHSQDDKGMTASSEAMIQISMFSLVLKRLA